MPEDDGLDEELGYFHSDSRQECFCLIVPCEVIGCDDDPPVSLCQWWERLKQLYSNSMERCSQGSDWLQESCRLRRSFLALLAFAARLDVEVDSLRELGPVVFFLKYVQVFCSPSALPSDHYGLLRRLPLEELQG